MSQPLGAILLGITPDPSGPGRSHWHKQPERIAGGLLESVGRYTYLKRFQTCAAKLNKPTSNGITPFAIN
jgi:hypothetical protein